MKKMYKILSIVLCMSVFAAFAIGSGSSSSSSSSTAKKVGETSDDADESKEDESKEGDVTPDSDQEEYKVGDTWTKDGLSITFVGSSYYKGDNEYDKPKKGNKFIRLDFHVMNESDSDQSVSYFDFNCFADGYDCEASYHDEGLSAELSKGRSADGPVFFEVPKDAKDIQVEYESNVFTDEKVKFIFEGDKDSGLTFEGDSSAKEDAFHVGDVIETEKLRIKYLKAGVYKSDNEFIQPKKGHKYVYIKLEVENISDSDANISYYSFNCYADGKACDGFYGMDDALSADLSKGRKAKGTIAFEVPKKAKTIEFECEDDIWSNNKVVFLYE